jgi:hypothetical protein
MAATVLQAITICMLLVNNRRTTVWCVLTVYARSVLCRLVCVFNALAQTEILAVAVLVPRTITILAQATARHAPATHIVGLAM